MNNDYWYIWFEVFENGKKIGSGLYNQAYSYKHNAVRRAKLMWDKPFYDPMTNSTITRKWIVSKTNPFEFERSELI